MRASGRDGHSRTGVSRHARHAGALILAAGLGASFGSGQTTPPPSATPTPSPSVSGAGQAPVPASPTAAPAAASKNQPVALCGDCHEDQAKTFPGNPHARPRKGFWGAGPGTGSPNALCESCHGDGTKHIESSGDKAFIRGFHSGKDADTCATCHVASTSHSSFSNGVHANSETVRCTTCHSVHSSDAKAGRLLAKAPGALCATCHPTQTALFRAKPFAHRLDRGGMDCTSCHDPHGRFADKAVRWTRTEELQCLGCHAEKRGPFVFEHAAGVVGKCTTCHEPHGSSNPKMLVRARVDRLCLECHSTLSASTLGSQPPSFHDIRSPRYQNCTTCHVAIHGSNLSPQLFK
jgi:DmsE family decaheme c-type cytochrome